MSAFHVLQILNTVANCAKHYISSKKPSKNWRFTRKLMGWFYEIVCFNPFVRNNQKNNQTYFENLNVLWNIRFKSFLAIFQHSAWMSYTRQLSKIHLSFASKFWQTSSLVVFFVRQIRISLKQNNVKGM